MVYCGKPSRGCQRCRQRKVKCDEAKPDCEKCRNAQIQCPGYRDMTNVIFRNQTAQVVRKLKPQDFDTSATPERRILSSVTHLSQPVCQLGANFFFTKYLLDLNTPFCDYHTWLIQLYSAHRPEGLFETAIEAIGLMGISNTSYAPELEYKAQERYSMAIAALKGVLNDPVQATLDTTLLAITLLILFETLNFKTWERYRYWSAHINAGLTLLELRGPDQFQRRRGVQLYMQIRSQVLLACMQQQVPVPKALVQSTYAFQSSTMRDQWRNNGFATPGSITEICFRVINLRAALRNGEMVDSRSIHAMMSDVHDDLEAWRAGLHPDWEYDTVAALGADSGCYNGLCHIYPNLWVAEAWNNWRGLRLLVVQTLMETCIDPNEMAGLQDIVRQMSTDICVSVSSFTERPQMISLIQALYMIALEPVNNFSLRSFAVEQLHLIDAAMGIRQASLLAETARSTFTNTSIPKNSWNR